MTRYKLSEICKIVSGSTPKTNVPEYWDGENVWITPAEITDKTFIVYDSQRKLSNLGVEKTHLSSFPKGTVILSSRAPIGKVAIAGVEMFCNQGFKNLICSEKIMNEYLYWFLKGKTKYLNSLGRGATFKELSAKIIGNIELEVPSIQEQKEVVIRLRKIDQIIGVFEREVELLDELIKARFVEMFGNPVSNSKDLPVQKMNNVAPICQYDGSFEESVWLLNLDMVESQTGRIINYNIVSKDEIGGSVCTFDENNVLYSKLRPYLNKVVVPDGKGYATSELVPLRPDPKIINRIYLAYLLRSNEFVEMIKEKVAGAKMPRVSMSDFREFNIPVPPLELQNQFASFVEEIDKSRSRIQKSLEASQELFDSLMQDYFG